MTTPPIPERPADPPHRRGRPPEPICKEAGLAHRTWLEPVRGRFTASGLTLDDLVGRSGFSKTRLSELMRGKGLYPTWEITYSVVRALDLPVGPLRRLWKVAAIEADKKPTWIDDRLQAVPPADTDERPLAHVALYQAMVVPYNAYAQAFLQSLPRARHAVGEVFDLLWLTWDDATSSPDMPRHAWQLLRTTVLSRAAQRPAGHYDLRAAAFSTTHQAQAPTSSNAWPASTSWPASSTRSPNSPTTRWTSPSCATCAVSTPTPSPPLSACPRPWSTPWTTTPAGPSSSSSPTPNPRSDPAVMSTIDALLAQSLLLREPHVPADVVPYDDLLDDDLLLWQHRADDTTDDSAAHSLDALCETVVSHCTPDQLADFLTDQIPQPATARILGCALHLAGIDIGARFWWQYAAGAEDAPASYCLYLQHLAHGEPHAAALWHAQTGLGYTADQDTPDAGEYVPALHSMSADSSLSTVLRVLAQLTRTLPTRRHTPAARAVIEFVASAVTGGYARHPDLEIPLPGTYFAEQLEIVIAATTSTRDHLQPPPAPPSAPSPADDLPNRLAPNEDRKHIPTKTTPKAPNTSWSR